MRDVRVVAVVLGAHDRENGPDIVIAEEFTVAGTLDVAQIEPPNTTHWLDDAIHGL